MIKPKSGVLDLLRLLPVGGPAICNVSVTNACNATCDFCNFAHDKGFVKHRTWLDADRFTEAAEVGEVVFGANPPSQAQTAFEVACSWAKAGDVDRSVSWLDCAADAGFRAASVVDGEPDLAVVRADPRWPVLRARLA